MHIVYDILSGYGTRMIRDGILSRVDCGYCGGTIEYSAVDILYRHDPPSGGFDEEGSDHYSILCLCCHMPIDVTHFANQKMREVVKARVLQSIAEM